MCYVFCSFHFFSFLQSISNCFVFQLTIFYLATAMEYVQQMTLQLECLIGRQFIALIIKHFSRILIDCGRTHASMDLFSKRLIKLIMFAKDMVIVDLYQFSAVPCKIYFISTSRCVRF